MGIVASAARVPQPTKVCLQVTSSGESPLFDHLDGEFRSPPLVLVGQRSELPKVERLDNLFGAVVTCNRDCEVDVSGEARVAADRHRQSADEAGINIELTEESDRSRGRPEQAHDGLTGPGASIGRSRIQSRSSCSIMASVAP